MWFSCSAIDEDPAPSEHIVAAGFTVTTVSTTWQRGIKPHKRPAVAFLSSRLTWCKNERDASVARHVQINDDLDAYLRHPTTHASSPNVSPGRAMVLKPLAYSRGQKSGRHVATMNCAVLPQLNSPVTSSVEAPFPA
jgi:hypothetical protein